MRKYINDISESPRNYEIFNEPWGKLEKLN